MHTSKAFILFGMLVALSVNTKAQDSAHHSRVNRFADLTGGIGNSQGSVALSYVHNWQTGKKRKFELGLGTRFTSYFGRNQYFRTAPAKLTSGKTGPGAIFSEDIDENIDTIFLNKPQINALNVSFNFGYHFSNRFSAGFNIDAIGFSFGAEKPATYYDGNNIPPPQAKPTTFNLLLISDNDLGTLNSELFLRYAVKGKWSVKLAYEFLFTEYTTTTKIQTTPDGQQNDRFRNKVSALGIGVSYKL